MLKFLTHNEQHRLQKQEKSGELMPGTALQTGTMMASARQIARPTVQTIQQKTIMDQQVKAQQAQQQAPQAPPQPAPKPGGPAATGQQQAPQAPKMGGNINPQAPSGNTPTAKTGGLQ